MALLERQLLVKPLLCFTFFHAEIFPLYATMRVPLGINF